MKCSNCGEHLLATFSREASALEILVCPHVKLHNKQYVNDMPIYAEIRCSDYPNCDGKFIKTYTRSGLNIMICSRVKMSATKALSGIPIHTEIACSLNVNGLMRSFEALKNGVDVTLEDLREATQHTVSNAALLEQANLALMLGLPTDNLANLFECAFQLGLAVGITPQRAIEALCMHAHLFAFSSFRFSKKKGGCPENRMCHNNETASLGKCILNFHECFPILLVVTYVLEACIIYNSYPIMCVAILVSLSYDFLY